MEALGVLTWPNSGRAALGTLRGGAGPRGKAMLTLPG